MSRTRVLISNDDGIFADGLVHLTRALFATGKYDLRVVAPAKQQSGVSHNITLHEAVYAEEYVLPGELSPIQAYKVWGTPADCVKVTLTGILGADWKPDLVVSGINFGLNVGTSVFYSGTVAAAVEALLNDIPSVALSLDFGKVFPVPSSELLWESAAKQAVRAVELALSGLLPKGYFLNVNLPNVKEEESKGFKLTRQGPSGYDEVFTEVASDDNRRKFKLRGKIANRDPDRNYDLSAVQDNYVSVTPIGMRWITPTYEADYALLATASLFIGVAPQAE